VSAESYIELAYLRHISVIGFDQAIGDGWMPEEIIIQHFREALPAALERYGFRAEQGYEDLIGKIVKGIIDRNGIVFEGDAYTGRYARLVSANKAIAVKTALEKNPVTSRIAQLGDAALQRALQVTASEEGWHIISEEDSESKENVQPHSDEPDIEIPASDRIVTLGHNQGEPLVSATEELIQTLENTTNSIDGDTNLRARILGQLRAAKELLIAGVFQFRVLQLTLIDALRFLATRYEKEAVGALAGALLTELFRVIGG